MMRSLLCCALMVSMANAIMITSFMEGGKDGFVYTFLGSYIDFKSNNNYANLCFDASQGNPSCFTPLTYNGNPKQFYLYPQIWVYPQIAIDRRYVLINGDNVLSQPFRVVKLPLTATATVDASNKLRLTITWNFNTDLITCNWYDQLRLYAVLPPKKLTFNIHDGNTLGQPANNPTMTGSNTWSIVSSDVSPNSFYFLQFSQAPPPTGVQAYDVSAWALFPDQSKTMFMFKDNAWYDGNNAPVPRA